MKYTFAKLDGRKGYVSNNLLLPKRQINLSPIKAALTFQYGEVTDIEEDGFVIKNRPGDLNLWEENSRHLIVPREFIPRSSYPEFQFEFVDLRPKLEDFKHVRYQDTITLRDECQRDAFQALVESEGGTLNLSCGKGKTVLALKLIATLGVPALVVVNTSALLEQWIQEARKFLRLEHIGVIQGDKADWNRPLVLGMIHTLALRRDSWGPEIRRHFGVVLFDEAHHVSAPLFVKCADLFYGRRYSLTATARRIDGLESIYQFHLGRIIYSDLSQDLIPRTVFQQLKWEFDSRYKNLVMDRQGDISLPKVRSYLGSLAWRNQLICSMLEKDIRVDGRKVLVLSHSVEHVKTLVESCQTLGLQAGSIMGSTPQKDRLDTLRNSNPVIGTFQLAREGLNRPELDTLYITTPFSSPNDLQQAWGRIQRICPGKKNPLVRVYEDHAFKRCVGSCRSLRRSLQSLKYPYRNEESYKEQR